MPLEDNTPEVGATTTDESKAAAANYIATAKKVSYSKYNKSWIAPQNKQLNNLKYFQQELNKFSLKRQKQVTQIKVRKKKKPKFKKRKAYL